MVQWLLLISSYDNSGCFKYIIHNKFLVWVMAHIIESWFEALRIHWFCISISFRTFNQIVFFVILIDIASKCLFIVKDILYLRREMLNLCKISLFMLIITNMSMPFVGLLRFHSWRKRKWPSQFPILNRRIHSPYWQSTVRVVLRNETHWKKEKMWLSNYLSQNPYSHEIKMYHFIF